MKDLLSPLKTIQFVDRDTLTANDYNPNKVLEKNLELLEQSILSNGFCFPIVVRSDMTIIDGYHRWIIAGRDPLKKLLGGKVPIVIVHHEDKAKDVYGTITFNRARGTHLLEPMERIVQDLLKSGKTVKEIGTQLGMRPEEVFRLTKMDREAFLDIMLKGHKTPSKARKITNTRQTS